MPEPNDTTSRRREVLPEHPQRLDDLMAMNVGDSDRERLVNYYLDKLIEVVANLQEPGESR